MIRLTICFINLSLITIIDLSARSLQTDINLISQPVFCVIRTRTHVFTQFVRINFQFIVCNLFAIVRFQSAFSQCCNRFVPYNSKSIINGNTCKPLLSGLSTQSVAHNFLCGCFFKHVFCDCSRVLFG